VTIVHEVSRGRSVGGGKSVLYKGRKTKFGKDSRKIRVRDPVVGFFLVEEYNSTVDRVLGGVTQDFTNSHGDISGIAILNEASLMRRDQVRKDGSKATSKHPGEDLNIAVGEGDRTPVGNVREVSARLGNKGHEGTRPRWRRGTSGQDRIEQRKKNRGEGFSKRLIPFIRNSVRTRGPA
jgi:hypothetical protein